MQPNRDGTTPCGKRWLRGVARLAAWLLVNPGGNALAATPLEGLWLTEPGDAVVEIGPCGAAVCGRIVWHQGGPDLLNDQDPEPKRRLLSICGLEVLSDIRPSGSSWTGATLYDPEDGETYRQVAVTPMGDRLRLTVRVLLFSESTVWTRPAVPVERCTTVARRP